MRLASAGACDGMLRWFEEYAKRLQEGVYVVSMQPKTHMDLGVPPTLAIDLYPLKPPVSNPWMRSPSCSEHQHLGGFISDAWDCCMIHTLQHCPIKTGHEVSHTAVTSTCSKLTIVGDLHADMDMVCHTGSARAAVDGLRA